MELVVTNQTPIEIALGIDEQGMTTARKLYEFLEMDSKNYSRWYKQNIENNSFAMENEDYFPFVINEEWGGRASKDAKLTSDFAKKLSMTAKNEKGEQARDYFVTVENITRDTQLQLQSLSPELRFMIQTEIKDRQQDKLLQQHEERFNQIEGNLPITPSECNLVSRKANARVKSVISENNLIVNKKQKGRLMNELRHDATIIAGVTQYNYILKKDLEKVIAYINNWYPSGATLAGIMGYEQQSLFKNEHKKRHSTTDQD
ncbi:antA/AntB antirepressor family protein [Thomasclavelia ramosa]|uniref:antA/AntB antirepressor family protein n=1 Tax=Thomasclavelia ramosa TaxID=1547 RepID=UPI0022E034D6|nr:antA/AntB antirepressor family protein [Thomasclavelia ramosa]